MYSGIVQGVGFRVTTQYIAHIHPVTGWVRNDPKGTVTLQAQGSPDAVETFLEAVRTRQASLIQAEQTSPVPAIPGDANFEIRR